jgi:hypothetical protein
MSSQPDIEAEFEALDNALETDMTVYLMGGGAMTFRGLKNATRDLDLLVSSRRDFELLHDLLRARGYETVENPVDEYASLGAALMLDKDDECRFDLFDREVIRKLRLTTGMKSRATDVFVGTHLRVSALSNEDIFLFKGVAGRPRDTDDMAELVEASQGLDYEVIVAELQAQLPLNTGETEWELLTGTPENHPVIALERAVLSLPMTLPTAFTSVIEREADRVYAEFEALGELRKGSSLAELTKHLTSRKSVDVASREGVEMIVSGLEEKDLVVREDDHVQVNDLDTTRE